MLLVVFFLVALCAPPSYVAARVNARNGAAVVAALRESGRGGAGGGPPATLGEARARHVGKIVELEELELGAGRVLAALPLKGVRTFASYVTHELRGAPAVASDRAPLCYAAEPSVGEYAVLCVGADAGGADQVRGVLVAAGSLANAKMLGVRDNGTLGVIEGSLEGLPPFDCDGDSLEQPAATATTQKRSHSTTSDATLLKRSHSTTSDAVSYQVELAIETDGELLAKFSGSTASMEAYIALLISVASHVYATEVMTELVIKSVSVWPSSAGDPWTPASCGGTGGMMTQLRSHWATAHATTPRDLVLALFGTSYGSTCGLAYLGQICSQGWGFALVKNVAGYGMLAASNPYQPAWDIIATTHELGHSFDSPHTFNYDCDTTGPIDRSYPGCLSQITNPVLASSGGASTCPGAGQGCFTIMSYGHKLTGGMANLALSFGNRPGTTAFEYGNAPQRQSNRMLAHVSTRPCTSIGPTPPTLPPTLATPTLPTLMPTSYPTSYPTAYPSMYPTPHPSPTVSPFPTPPTPPPSPAPTPSPTHAPTSPPSLPPLPPPADDDEKALRGNAEEASAHSDASYLWMLIFVVALLLCAALLVVLKLVLYQRTQRRAARRHHPRSYNSSDASSRASGTVSSAAASRVFNFQAPSYRRRTQSRRSGSYAASRRSDIAVNPLHGVRASQEYMNESVQEGRGSAAAQYRPLGGTLRATPPRPLPKPPQPRMFAPMTPSRPMAMAPRPPPSSLAQWKQRERQQQQQQPSPSPASAQPPVGFAALRARFEQ